MRGEGYHRTWGHCEEEEEVITKICYEILLEIVLITYSNI